MYFSDISKEFRVLDSSKYFVSILEVGCAMEDFAMEDPVNTEILYEDLSY